MRNFYGMEFQMKMLMMFVALSIPCFADEVALKDGRKIEWRSIEDLGEGYLIITPEGSRVQVKRSDVVSFSKTEPLSPLVGAQMALDKKGKLEAIDLLKKIDTEKGVRSGVWKFDSRGVLSGVSSANGGALLEIPCTPPSDEYNLTVFLERTEGADNVGIGLATSAGQFMYHLDIDMGAYHGILSPDGGGHKKITSTLGKQLQQGKTKAIVFLVRKAALVVQIDGKDVCAVRQDWSKVSILPQCAPTSREAFALFALNSGIKISKMELVFSSVGQK